MRKLVFILFLLGTMVSCKSEDSSEEYIGTWLEVKQKGNEFVLVDCGYDGESIKTSRDSIFEKGIMEDSNMKIDHVKLNKDGISLFTDKSEKSYYRFQWIDKNKGISKWEITYDGSSTVVKYFVNKLNFKSIKTVKGTKVDCITSDDVGDLANDSIDIINQDSLAIWRGVYHFEASNRDNEKTVFDIIIKSLDDISVNIDDAGSKEEYLDIKGEKVSENKIKIAYNKAFEDEMGIIFIEVNEDKFYISGNPIYFINPGNNEFPLTKIK